MQAQLLLWTFFGTFAIAFGWFWNKPPSIGNKLPTFTSINPNSITVGGFSSGAAFATQVLAFYVPGKAEGISSCHFSPKCFYPFWVPSVPSTHIEAHTYMS